MEIHLPPFYGCCCCYYYYCSSSTGALWLLTNFACAYGGTVA
jgi:hypothetical protein